MAHISRAGDTVVLPIASQQARHLQGGWSVQGNISKNILRTVLRASLNVSQVNRRETQRGLSGPTAVELAGLVSHQETAEFKTHLENQ